MSNSYFNFKEFSVDMEGCSMKVGTDGVLLGAWFTPRRGRLLDIGTGSGLIALMAAQRGVEDITAVEITASAAECAALNAARSAWSTRIKVLHADVLSLPAQGLKYDSIVSNPPYFHDSLRSPNLIRSVARHADTLTFEQLVACAESMLTSGGEFSLVIPFDASGLFERLCFLQGLYLKRKSAVVTHEGRQPKRVLLSFVRSRTNPEIETLTMFDKENHITSAYHKLVSPFYLNL